jgi:hypothetical protein
MPVAARQGGGMRGNRSHPRTFDTVREFVKPHSSARVGRTV